MSATEILQGKNFFRSGGLALPNTRNKELIVSSGPEKHHLTARSLALIAIEMRKHEAFFAKKHDLNIRFSDDFNGSGNQGLWISSPYSANLYEGSWQLSVVFSPCYNDEYLYKSDLIRDTRSGYPFTSKVEANTRFDVYKVFLNKTPKEFCNWFDNSYIIWKEDIERLSKPHDNLREWVNSGFSMTVRCVICDSYGTDFAVISNVDLQNYLSKGMNLAELKERLVCKQCGQRKAKIAAY